jgi:hypothetical protein
MDQRELLARLAATPKTLAHLVVEADEAAMDARPAGGGWSARTILAHFRDDEMLCMRTALARMLAEATPEVHFLDGADWEPERNRGRDRKEMLLADFALQRQATLNMFASLRPGDWSRTATSGGGEPFSVSDFLGAWVRHDAEHIAQLEAAVGETLSDVLERRARPPEE